MSPWFLLALLSLSTAVGYKLLRDVPPLLHTPLMSGMNALSGITILGALQLLGNLSVADGGGTAGHSALAAAAVALAMVNVVGGFVVTGRMLRMFSDKK